MRRGSRFDGRVAFLVIAALAVAPLAFGGCGSSSSSPTPPPPGPLAVEADPAGGNFSAAQNVELIASGEGSSTAMIYYTTDLSDPSDDTNAGRMEYTGPFSVGDDNTVLKFFAMPTEGDATDVATEGYTFESGIGADWAESGHGDIAAEAWRHWDFDDPPEIPTFCAKCHSEDGFKDWAMDGTVDSAVTNLPYGLECTACHDFPGTLYDDLATYTQLDHVEFPSGDTATLASSNNLCISCHQGRNSKVQVDGATPNDEMQDPDYESYDFINIHYYPAAASLFGNEVQGAYQYLDPEEYVSRNTFPSHPDSLSTCVGCHMREDESNHTWFPDLARCLECHDGDNFTTLSGSPAINYAAIMTATDELFAEIEDYAANLGYPLIYASNYPYFFNDNGQGPIYPNRYRNFDVTLLRAAYNYQYARKDPCGYLHNGTYMRQVLHDSIVDLGGTPSDIPSGRAGYVPPANMFAAVTDQWHQSAHGSSGDDAFRHWDEDPAPQVVPDRCGRCHTSPGYADWALDNSVDNDYSPLSAVGCIACHKSANLYDDTDTRWDELANTALRPVEFPSGLTGDLSGNSNVCMGCHQGRSSGPDVEQAIIDDAPGPYSFINIHYYPAAATFFGGDVKGGVQYRADGAYRGENTFAAHGGQFDTCIACHMIDGDHSFEPPALSNCAPCHGNPPAGWKDQFGGTPGTNYTTIQNLLSTLYAEIQAYASGTIGTGIYYDSSAYPYFFTEGGPPIYPNRYVLFDATLLRAAYNYQMGLKDPCGYIHNGIYIRQILYDSLDDLDNGAQDNSVGGFTRP